MKKTWRNDERCVWSKFRSHKFSNLLYYSFITTWCEFRRFVIRAFVDVDVLCSWMKWKIERWRREKRNRKNGDESLHPKIKLPVAVGIWLRGRSWPFCNFEFFENMGNRLRWNSATWRPFTVFFFWLFGFFNCPYPKLKTPKPKNFEFTQFLSRELEIQFSRKITLCWMVRRGK